MRWVFAQDFGCTIVQMCNLKNTNIVHELKVKTKEFDKKIVEVKDTHIFNDILSSRFVSFCFFINIFFFAL